jgi:hypothetical protein
MGAASAPMASHAGLSQFNSFNNVVWRNDPDHVELSEAEAWRSTMVTSLTGSDALLTDKPGDTWRHSSSRRGGQRQCCSPSPASCRRRSVALVRTIARRGRRERARAEAVRRGLTPAVDLYALEIARPFESWMVLGRTGGRFEAIASGPRPRSARAISCSTTGSGRPTRRAPRVVRTSARCRLRSTRRSSSSASSSTGRSSPATNRHITGGGVDLIGLSWSDGVLAGRSRVVADDPYEIFLTEPDGWSFDSMRCDGATPRPATRGSAGLVTGCTAAASGEVTWRATFTRRVP